MSNRAEINMEDLDKVVGGALKFSKGTVYPKDNPSAEYTYTCNIADIYSYISQNWPGGAYNEETLKMLERAGYVKKAY